MLRARRSLVVALAVYLVTIPFAAEAQESPIKMSVIAGFQNRYLGLDPIPVSVTLESRRAVSGFISVVAERNGRLVEHLIRAEVPAGGKKQFDLLSTPSPEIVIEFRTLDGRRLKRIKQNLLVSEGTLVGIVDQSVPASLQTTSASSKEFPMLAVSFRKEWLRLGPGALMTLTHVVIDQETAGALGPAERRTIIDWTSTGGTLILAGPDMNRFGWLPSGWRTSGTRAGVQAGAGRSITLGKSLVDSSFDQSIWKSMIVPLPTKGVMESTNSGPSDGTEVQVANLLALDARRDVNLRWLMAFLAIYVVAVGPLNYLVLRRKGKKELLWITLPALALTFSVIGLGLSRGTRQDLTVRQANVVFATAEGSIGRRLALVATGKQTRTRVHVDGSYLVPIHPYGSYGPYGYPFPGSSSSARTRQPPAVANSSGTSIDARTDPFSGKVLAANAAPSKGYLQAHLQWDGKGFFGTVTNRTPYEMSEVFLLMGLETMHAGRLAPGKSAPLAYVPPRPGERQDPSHIFSGSQDSSYSSGYSFGGSSGRVANALSVSYGDQVPVQDVRFGLISMLDRVVGNGRPTGSPLVVGLTSKFRPSLELDGNRISPEGISMIASPVTFSVEPRASEHLPAIAGSTAMTRTIQNSSNPGAHIGGPYMSTGPYPSSPSAWLPLAPSSQTFFTSRLPLGIDPSAVTSLALRVGTDASPPTTSAQGPPGTTPPTPPSAEFTVEVFDWVVAGWVPFKFQSGSSVNKLTRQMLGSDGGVLFKLDAPSDRSLSMWEIGIEAEVS